MLQSPEHAVPQKYTQGMILSYVALVSALVRSGTIKTEDVIAEIDVFITLLTTTHPDSTEIIITMNIARDAILSYHPKDDNTLWFSDFIGNA